MNVPDDLLLTVLDGELRGRCVRLDRPVAVGSNRESDLHLRDAAVSWNHARLRLDGDRVVVEDLGSANGTFVNDRSVERAQLRVGDHLRVGSTRLRVEDGGGSEGGPDE